MIDFTDRRLDLAHRLNAFVGGGADFVDVATDLFGRAGSLGRQLLHLGGDHGKALTRFTGPRRLNGRVQCQQIRLRRDA